MLLQIAAHLGTMGFLGIVPALTMLCSGTEMAPMHRCGKPDPKQMLTGICRVLQQSGFEVESEKISARAFAVVVQWLLYGVGWGWGRNSFLPEAEGAAVKVTRLAVGSPPFSFQIFFP